MTFEPLLKIAVGTLLGIRYEYFYIFGLNPEIDGATSWPEPHVKMKYGTYVAAPRFWRIVLHLSGCVGSVWAFWIVAGIAGSALPVARATCLILFWLIVALNAALFLMGLAGESSLGKFKLRHSSGASAAREIREALGRSRRTHAIQQRPT